VSIVEFAATATAFETWLFLVTAVWFGVFLGRASWGK